MGKSKLWILAGIVIALSCDNPPAAVAQAHRDFHVVESGGDTTWVLHDDKRNVTCYGFSYTYWQWGGYGGISCMPDWQWQKSDAVKP
jgi:hypothetical protein